MKGSKRSSESRSRCCSVKNKVDSETEIGLAEGSDEAVVAAPSKRRRKTKTDDDGARSDSPLATEEETVFDLSLRPRSLGDFVGEWLFSDALFERECTPTGIFNFGAAARF